MPVRGFPEDFNYTHKILPFGDRPAFVEGATCIKCGQAWYEIVALGRVRCPECGHKGTAHGTLDEVEGGLVYRLELEFEEDA